MCLLERVTAWDANQITCEASSHRAANNPLRAYGRLGASCGIEYAAQAMAVHGALMAEAFCSANSAIPEPQAGYLASVRSVSLQVEKLDDISGPLTIQAERMSGDASTILYSFSLHAGPALLLSGRAVVVLNAGGLALPPAGHTSKSGDLATPASTAKTL
jgi:predicted hotdog family 3-hydroxylacyl-ACP dehydratase